MTGNFAIFLVRGSAEVDRPPPSAAAGGSLSARPAAALWKPENWEKVASEPRPIWQIPAKAQKISIAAKGRKILKRKKSALRLKKPCGRSVSTRSRPFDRARAAMGL